MAQYFAVAFYVLQRSFRPEMVGREAVGVGVGVIGTLESLQENPVRSTDWQI